MSCSCAGGPERCGCCEGVTRLTPASLASRPGLARLPYRAGTHASFLETMLASLSRVGVPADSAVEDGGRVLRPLQNLRTRTRDDPSIALLDAWATVADVLTFYQERIANEGYLRTAVERGSILELGRLVGYRPRPGVAASVHLAFDLEEGFRIEIPRGTKAQSIPVEPGDLPQAFETSEPLEARDVWNRLEPRRTRPAVVELQHDGPLYVLGAPLPVAPGDALLLEFASGAGEARAVQDVEPDVEVGRTRIELQPLGGQDPLVASVADETRRFLDRLLDLEAYGLDPSTKLTQRVAGHLQALRQDLGVSGSRSRRAVMTLLEGARDVLEAAVVEAEERRATRIGPWVGAAAREVGELAGRFAQAAGLAPAPPARELTDLAGLLPALATPPSRQPAGTTALARSPRRVWTAEGDLLPSMVASLRPAAAGGLWQAWGNAVVTETASFVAPHRFRTRAAPFGHNAPLQPVLDDGGLVIGRREWPLGPSAAVHLQVFPERLWDTVFKESGAFSVVVDVTCGDRLERFSQNVDDGVSDEGPITLGSGPLALVLTVDRQEGTMTLNAEAAGLGVIFWRLGDEDLSVAVTVQAGKEKRVIHPGQTVFFEADGRGVTAALRDEADGAGAGSAADRRRLTISVDGAIPLPHEDRRVLPLDAVYEGIVPGGWVIVERRGAATAHRVVEVLTTSRADYGITARVTELVLETAWLTDDDVLLTVARETALHVVSERLEPAPEPVVEDVAGGTIELGRLYDGLDAGRWIMVRGERTDIPGTAGVVGAELAMIAGITHGFDPDLPGDTVHTTISLAAPLAYEYAREGLEIYGNVVGATRGETRAETLGSGDASLPFQRFALTFTPLTFVSAPDPSGVATTLDVLVDKVRWHEARTLADRGPRDHAYTVETADDGATTVTFGDGRHGARLPTGVENVTASYRQGLGRLGNIGALQISQLASRPLGLKGVVNPRPASGGADPEGADQARRTIPRTLTSLGRLVGVRDYEDFALGFAGIGKASAALLSDGTRRVVHLTIAGQDDGPIEEDSDLLRNLRDALRRFGDPHTAIRVARRELLALFVVARVQVHPDHRWRDVSPRLRSALTAAFGFDRRELGQPVALSELIGVAAALRGVVSVNVNVLQSIPEDITPDELAAQLPDLVDEPPDQVIRAELARVNGGRILPAQLAVLRAEVPDTLLLQEMAP